MAAAVSLPTLPCVCGQVCAALRITARPRPRSRAGASAPRARPTPVAHPHRRLAQIRAQLHRGHRGIGHQDHQHVVALTRLAQEVDAREAGHHDVAHDDIEATPLDRDGRARGAGHVMTRARERPRDGADDRVVIVDKEHLAQTSFLVVARARMWVTVYPRSLLPRRGWRRAARPPCGRRPDG